MKSGRFGPMVLAAGMLLAVTPEALAKDVRVAHFFVQKSVIAEVDQGFADKVNASTDLNVKIFWAGALGGAKEILALVSGGAVQMGATVPSYYPSQLRVASIGSSPLFYFKSPQVALEVTRAIVRSDPAGIAEMKGANIEPLVIHTAAPYRLVCNKPVATMDDLKGLKVRTFSAIAKKAMAAAGSVPVSMPSGEVYEALQRGTIDCAMYNNEFSTSRKLHEVAKYWSTVNFGAISGTQLFANRDFMNSLPKETADEVREAGRNAEQAEVAKVSAADEAAAKIAKAAGVKFVEFKDQEKLEKLIPDTLEMWAEDLIAKGTPKEDVERIVNLVREKTKK